MSDLVLKNISIVVPTIDRPEWCERLINYYNNSNFPGYLIFCDSSSIEQYSRLNEFIKKTNNKKIIHLELRNITLHKAIEKGIAVATEKTLFFTQSGDDDFFDLNGLTACAKFLNNNTEFYSCVGNGYIIKYIESKNSFTFKWVIKYWNPRKITNSLPNDRVYNILSKYYNLEFSLRRTSGASASYKQMNNFLGDLSFQQSTIAEICSVINIAFSGKSGYVNFPYLFRGEHSQRPNAKKNTYPNSDYIFENRIQTYEKYQLLLNKNLGEKIPEFQLKIRKFYLEYTENLFKNINYKSGKYYKFLQLPKRLGKKIQGVAYKVRYKKTIRKFT